MALQVVKRKGFNLIETASAVKVLVADRAEQWPEELKTAVEVGTSNDQSRVVDSMVQQLLGSVFTAIALVMIVVLAALGIRAALLVGFAIPTSFLLCFAFLALMGISISNIVMFGLILAVGMLVDSAIVVVEYADQQQQKGSGPMQAYVEAAKRMFWPVISSTATTLCAFLPMLFWPGVPGQFMGMLPVTLIFVLSASLVVALVYLPVMGGVTGRMEQWMSSNMVRIAALPWYLHFLLFVVAAVMVFPALALLGPSKAGDPGLVFQWIGARFGAMDGLDLLTSVIPTFAAVFGLVLVAAAVLLVALGGFMLFLLAIFAVLTRLGSWGRWIAARMFRKQPDRVFSGYKRSPFGRLIELIAGNPIMPLVMCGIVFIFVGTTMIFFGNNSKGVEFFVRSEPEQAIVYVLARGNLSLEEKDDLLRQAEQVVLDHPGIATAFAFAGEGGWIATRAARKRPKTLSVKCSWRQSRGKSARCNLNLTAIS